MKHLTYVNQHYPPSNDALGVMIIELSEDKVRNIKVIYHHRVVNGVKVTGL